MDKDVVRKHNLIGIAKKTGIGICYVDTRFFDRVLEIIKAKTGDCASKYKIAPGAYLRPGLSSARKLVKQSVKV